MIYIKLRFYERIIHKIYIYHRQKFVLRRKYVNLINNLRRFGLRSKVKSIFNKSLRESRGLRQNISIPSLTNDNSGNSHSLSFQTDKIQLDPKKIGVCIGSLGHGGAEKQWVLLAAGLKALGYTPIFIIQQNLNEASPSYVKFLNEQNINIISISDIRDFSNAIIKDNYFPEQKYFYEESLREFTKLYNDQDQILKYTIKYLSNSGFSSLFIALDYANIFFGSAGLIANIPKLLISFRSISPSFYHENDFAPELYKSIVERDEVVLHGNAEHVLQSYNMYFQNPKEINLISNLQYDLDNNEYEKCPCGKFHILGFMRLSREKNPQAWCRAAEYIFDNLEFKFHFILSGNGPDFSKIFDEIIRLKLKGLDIELTYSQDSVASMRKFFPGLLINSSLTEGHSNLLIESNSINYPTYSLYESYLDSSVDNNNKDFSNVKLILFVASLISDTNPSIDLKGYVNDIAPLKSHAAKFLNLIQ
jgi:hypothetical protein